MEEDLIIMKNCKLDFHFFQNKEFITSGLSISQINNVS